MKIICNDIDSSEISNIFKQLDSMRYVSVEWIELTKKTSSRREKPGDPMQQIIVDCIKVRGKSILGWSGDTTNGTRYVYEDERLFMSLHNWMTNHLVTTRENKLKELGIID
jgi:hypothetical protein